MPRSSASSFKWGDVEAWLAEEVGWFRLSATERLALPQGQALTEIDQRLEPLVRDREALLRSIPELAATHRSAVIAKIKVVSHLLSPDDFPEAHAVVISVLRDLGAPVSDQV